jgi:hypothetical protein
MRIKSKDAQKTGALFIIRQNCGQLELREVGRFCWKFETAGTAKAALAAPATPEVLAA